MVEIRLNLDPEARRFLSESLLEYAATLDTGRHDERSSMNSDPELRELWGKELVRQLQADAAQLVGFFSGAEFGKGVIRLNEQESEAVMRACSAIRLRIRELALAELSDAELETGDFEPRDLPEGEQQGLQCYIFLAALQSHLVEAIDPAAAESDEGL